MQRESSSFVACLQPVMRTLTASFLYGKIVLAPASFFARCEVLVTLSNCRWRSELKNALLAIGVDPVAETLARFSNSADDPADVMVDMNTVRAPLPYCRSATPSPL
jgi:hypothetical protein